MRCRSQISNDGHLRAIFYHIKHVTNLNAAASVLSGVGPVFDLQYMSLDVPSLAGEEALDVVAVDRQSPVKAEFAADRGQPAQAAKSHPSYRRRAGAYL